MFFSPQQVEAMTTELRESLGSNIPWKYEEKYHVMLSEFAQNKADVVLANLRKTLPDEWQGKNAKKLPVELKEQLGSLAKLSKNQKILALSANENKPTMVAFWWPWDHGGTYSLRIMILNNSYENMANNSSSSGIFSKLKALFTRE